MSSRPSQQRPEGTEVVVSPVNRRVIRHRVDQVGNDLTAVLRWCSTHHEPVWQYGDGSSECPHVRIVGWDQGACELTDAPWEATIGASDDRAAIAATLDEFAVRCDSARLVERGYESQDVVDAARAAARLLREVPADEDAAHWKAQALEVIDGWERVFDALGKPGPLGAFKSSNALAEVERLQADLDAATRRRADEDVLARAKRLLDGYPEDVFPPLPDGFVPADEFDGWVGESDSESVAVTPDAFGAHAIRRVALPVIAQLVAEIERLAAAGPGSGAPA